MTHAEWEAICRIETAVARVEERLSAHCAEEERRERRALTLPAKFSAVAAWLALAVAAASFILR